MHDPSSYSALELARMIRREELSSVDLTRQNELGLPFAVQLVGRPGADAQTLALSRQLERAMEQK